MRGARRNDTSSPVGAPDAQRAISVSARVPGRPPRAEQGEAGADERAVVAVEGRDVADRADGDEVEPAPHVEGDAELGADARRHRQRQADGRQALVREAALGAVRVEERQRRERRVGDAVVVDDDGVDARGAHARRGARDRSSRSRT